MSFLKSKELFDRAIKVAPGGVHSPVRAFKGVGGTPRFIESAKGSRLKDVDGNEYVDFCMSWGPLIFGHQDAEILDSVKSALTRGWSYGTAEPYSLELAEWICREIPWVEKIRFVNSGTEAVMAALRVARAATGRSKIVKFDGCYHGHTDSMLVKAGSGLAEMASPDSAGVSPEVAGETLVLPLDDLAAVEKAFQLHGKEIAAVIVEPIPANNGLLLQTDAFLKQLRTLTTQHGSLLIFDEVITGFRMALGGMAEKTGIRPDLVTYGKIIGAGFPTGGYGGRADLMDWVAPAGPVYQAGTLSANPVAMVAGLTALKKLKRENPYPVLEAKVLSLGTQVERIGTELDLPIKVQSAGSMFWTLFGPLDGKSDSARAGWVRSPSDFPSLHKKTYAEVFHQLLGLGYYLAPSAYEVSFLSTAHTEQDLTGFVTALREAIVRLR